MTSQDPIPVDDDSWGRIMKENEFPLDSSSSEEEEGDEAEHVIREIGEGSPPTPHAWQSPYFTPLSQMSDDDESIPATEIVRPSGSSNKTSSDDNSLARLLSEQSSSAEFGSEWEGLFDTPSQQLSQASDSDPTQIELSPTSNGDTRAARATTMSVSSEAPPQDLFVDSNTQDALFYGPESAAGDLPYQAEYVQGAASPSSQVSLTRYAEERSFELSPIFRVLVAKFGFIRAVILFLTRGLRLLARESNAYSDDVVSISIVGTSDDVNVRDQDISGSVVGDDSTLNLYTLPQELYGLRSLRRLVLQNVGLENLNMSPTVQNNLESLEVLDLSENDSLQWLPPALFQLPALEKLNLRGTDIDFKKDDPLFETMPALTEVNLSGTALERVPDSLTALQRLRTLNLANTGLREFPAVRQWRSSPEVDITDTLYEQQVERPYRKRIKLVIPEVRMSAKRGKEEEDDEDAGGKRRRIGARRRIPQRPRGRAYQRTIIALRR